MQPNLQNKAKETPLHIVCAQKHRKSTIKIIAILLKYGADPLIQNLETQTALDVAKAQEDPDEDTEDVIEMLSDKVHQKLADALRLVSGFNTPKSPDTDHVEFGSPTPISSISKLLQLQSPEQQFDNIAVESSYPQTGKDVPPPKLLSLTSNEVMNLRAQRVARDNPFGLHRRRTTAILDGLLELSEANNRIPDLEGWLKSKNSKGKYQKYFVAVKGAHILWAYKQTTITDTTDKAQRRRFRGHYNLYSVSRVKALTKGSNHRLKWSLSIGEECEDRPTKVFVWRAETEEDRDKWVQGLQQRKQLLDSYCAYLDDDDSIMDDLTCDV